MLTNKGILEEADGRQGVDSKPEVDRRYQYLMSKKEFSIKVKRFSGEWVV